MSEIAFFVPGIPRPGGSKKGFVNPKTGGVILVDAGTHTAAWKKTVRAYAEKIYRGEPLQGPVSLDIRFVMPRPKGHYGTGRNAGVLKCSAPIYHTIKPDRTKLLRSTEDALTGIVWKDDSQVCIGPIYKVYGDEPGALIKVKAVTG
jgi:Holliday junction resolvase RusA-like endonuclease